MPTKTTPEILTAAILGFEQQKRQIDAQITDLRSMLSGGPAKAAATPGASTGKRKKFSAASRRKMAMAQRARWAAIRGESEPSTPEAAKPKRKLSAAGRKAISDATKKRWAAKRAAAKTATKPAASTRKKGTAKKSASQETAAAS